MCYFICCFSLAAFNICSLCLIFVNLITMCLGVFSLGFILFGTLWVSWTWVIISFPILGKFSTIISSSIFSCSFFLSSSSGTPMIQMLERLILSWRSLRLSSFLLILLIALVFIFSSACFSFSWGVVFPCPVCNLVMVSCFLLCLLFALLSGPREMPKCNAVNLSE